MREFRERMKRGVIFTVKGCYRSICNHPFIGGMLGLLVFLYRSYPFMFSFLVSVSPVLACTAILLGTLLSFGKPNIPEIEREERTTNGIVSLKTGVSENSVVFDRTESVSVEIYGDREKDVVEVVDQLVEETCSVANAIYRDRSDGSFSRLLEKRSKEIESDDNLELESESELFEERFDNGRMVENHYSLIPDVDDEYDLENDRSPTGSVDSKMVNVDCLDSPPCTPWRHVNQEDEDDEAFDSGSDRAESSSPDASMADILPVLDELQPLLDEDAPRPLNLSYDGSDAASEQSASSSDESSNESDDDTEKEVSEVAEDDKDGEDEEEKHGEEDQTKSRITWTEEDERNLMDLGSSELERNQRLENLVARRRARKTMSVEPETNLIDLESTDLTFDVPSISTTRKNPFTVSQDSYKDMGLPPIPGSAPSVLLHHRNPFDIPYDSSEEKPDLKEDSFEKEFTPLQSKEHFVRRHESFNAWRTPFRNDRPEKKDMTRFRPYFVAEPLGSEEMSYSHFQRQLSGLSDSFASSVPDVGSDGWSEDTERWYVSEEGTFAIDERDSFDDDILDHITITEHAYELARHGSESSEEEHSIELGRLEKRRITNDETDMKLEDNKEAKSSIVAEQRLGNQFEISLTKNYSNIEGREQRYGNISSSSSLSEESERIYVEKEAEEYSSFIDGLYQHEEQSMSAQPSLLQGSNLNIISPLGDAPSHRDPIYDLSPLDVRQTVSRSSNDFEFAHWVIKKSVSFSEIVAVIGSQEIECDSADNDFEFAECSGSQSVEEVVLSQNSFNKPSLEDQKEALESKILVKSFEEAMCANRYSNPSISKIVNKLILALEVTSNPDFIAVPPEVFGCQAVDEINEIKEIDELEELDNVGDFRVNEFREIDGHVEFDSQVSHVRHDAESPLTLIEENPTQTHATEQDTVELGSTIKEFDQYNEDMKHATEFKIYRSPVHTIEILQYDGKGLDASDLESPEENTYSKAKETDIKGNSLGEISDIEENDPVMAEIEAHFAKTTEAIISKTELIQVQSGAVPLHHPPSFVDLTLEGNITSRSESIATDTTQGQANIHMVTQEFQDSEKDLDLNKSLEDNVEHVLISGSMLSAEGAKDSEGSCLQLLVSERHSLNDSDSVLKQDSKSSSSEALGYSEDGTAKDVQADLDFLRESNSRVKESDVQNNLQNPYEDSDMVEAKLQESDDVLISDRKFLDDYFSALKPESQSSPSEALKISEDVRGNNYSEWEAKSGAEDNDEKRTHQQILNGLLKLFEDGSGDNVEIDTDSRREMESSTEESDVKESRQNSLEEPNFVEVKTPESRDALYQISETTSKILTSNVRVQARV